MKRILVFDPGVTTGWCYCDGTGTYESGTFLKWLRIEALLAEYTPDLVVVEKFVLYPSAAQHKIWSDFPTVEVIGVIRYLCGSKRIPMVLQGANEVAQIKITARLMSTPHERDALRHAIKYYQGEKLHGPYRKYYTLRSSKRSANKRARNGT